MRGTLEDLVIGCVAQRLARTWEKHDVGATPGFDGDVERALRGGVYPGRHPDADPSLWGRTAGAASNPADSKFLERNHRAVPCSGAVGLQRDRQSGDRTTVPGGSRYDLPTGNPACDEGRVIASLLPGELPSASVVGGTPETVGIRAIPHVPEQL